MCGMSVTEIAVKGSSAQKFYDHTLSHTDSKHMMTHAKPLLFKLTVRLILILITTSVWAQEPLIKPQKKTKPQRALDLSKKTGLSILSISEGVSGLGINIGLNSNSFMEFILSGDWRQPSSRSAETQLYLSLGAHLQMIQAGDQAAFTLGGRLHITYNELCDTDPALCADRSTISTPIPQYALEVPLRIYWFPNQYVSLHSELGASFSWGQQGASEGSTGLEGYTVTIFSQSTLVGRLGLTLWF